MKNPEIYNLFDQINPRLPLNYEEREQAFREQAEADRLAEASDFEAAASAEALKRQHEFLRQLGKNGLALALMANSVDNGKNI